MQELARGGNLYVCHVVVVHIHDLIQTASVHCRIVWAELPRGKLLVNCFFRQR